MTPPPPEPLGEKSAGILLSMFQDVYRQELGAEEDIHRTLPFFATALGLILAALNYAAAQLPKWSDLTKYCGKASFEWDWFICSWPVTISGFLFSLATAFSIAVLWSLAGATKRRGYDRIGPEDALLSRAQALQEYHKKVGLAGPDLDNAVLVDLRQQLLQDYAEAIPLNRERTLQRYRLRARAVSFLLGSLFAAVVATILMMATIKFGLVKAIP